MDKKKLKQMTALEKSLIQNIQILKKRESFLHLPNKLPEKYELSLKEIERRKNIESKIQYLQSKLSGLLSKERVQRSKFLDVHGKFVPQSVLPDLYTPHIVVSVTGTSAYDSQNQEKTID